MVYVLYRLWFHVQNLRTTFLLLASFVFYAWWSPVHLLLLVYSGLTDFYICRAMDRSKKHRRSWMWLSVINNVGLLCVFKYSGPVLKSLNEFLVGTPLAYRFIEPDWVLPVGISFYTFQTMSYSIDVYRKSVKPLEKPVDMMMYVAFFPQLVAGPILRASEFVPQMAKSFKFDSRCFFQGLSFIFLGLIKKVAIADPLGVHYVDPVYASLSTAGSADLIFATLAYAMQIFHDFSGYSDIAIGVALLLGFKISKNFDRPFLSCNPVEFWQRWHISLSFWVRDYIYYPLCFSGPLKGRLILSLWLSLVIIGVWHGASMTYFWFGVFHGTLAVLHNVSKKKLTRFGEKLGKFYPVLAWLCFFCLLLYGEMIFRVNSAQDILVFTRQLFHADAAFSILSPNLAMVLSIAAAFAVHSISDASLRKAGDWLHERHTVVQVALSWACVMIIWHGLFMVQGQQAFIYFQF